MPTGPHGRLGFASVALACIGCSHPATTPSAVADAHGFLGTYIDADPDHRRETLDRIYALFPVLRERASQRAGTLSGGEGQMLAIARALMSRPRLLMLDEPSLGIMPRMVDAILEVLGRLRGEGLTILLVEQNVPAALDVADRGYVVQTGRMVLSGASAELRDSELVKKAYLGM